MKKILMALAVMCLATAPAGAQDNRDKGGKAAAEQAWQRRAEAMAGRLMLDDGTKAKFVPMYKEYVGKLSEARRPAKVAPKNAAQPTDKEILEGIEQEMDAQQKALDVKKAYYKRFKGMLNARQLKQLFGRRDFASRNRFPLGRPAKLKLDKKADTRR